MRHDIVTTVESDFADWYGALWPRVLRAVTITVGDAHMAEEATAEAFAKAYAKWPATADLTSPQAWLHRVAVNEVRSRWRRSKIERKVLDRLTAERIMHHPGPEPRDDALWTAVAALSDRARQMVALRYVLDLPEAEIAMVMGITRGTVASTLSKARQQLSTILTVAEPAHD